MSCQQEYRREKATAHFLELKVKDVKIVLAYQRKLSPKLVVEETENNLVLGFLQNLCLINCWPQGKGSKIDAPKEDC